MAKFRSIKNSFSAGEISSSASARTDLPQYAHSCKLMKNFIPMLSGGAYRRPGTLFEARINGRTDYAPRLIPFTVSKTENYMLAFGAIAGGATYVNSYRTTSNVAQSTQAVVTGTHPYGYSVFLSGILEDEITYVKYAQSVDVMHLVHPSYKPQKVTRTATDTFTIADFDSGLTGTSFRDAYPYRPLNTTATTLTPSLTTVGTGRTITASAALFTDNSWIGKVFKVLDTDGATVGCFKITAWTSTTVVTVQIFVALGSTDARTTWWEASWSNQRGWPRTVGYYQQRRFFAGNNSEPDSIWFSQTNNYDKMSDTFILDITKTPPVPLTGAGSVIADGRSYPVGSNPFQIQLSSQQLNTINWANPGKALLLGTSGDEFSIDIGPANSGFSCQNYVATPMSHYGSAYLDSVRVGSEVFMALQSQDEVRSYVYNYVDSSYSADPIQLLHDNHPAEDRSIYFGGSRRYKTFSWDQSRSTLWCVDTRGNLFGATRDRKMNATMWHSHELGGFDANKFGVTVTFGTGTYQDSAHYNCAGSVISMALIPNPTIGINDIWLVVKRVAPTGIPYWDIERMIGKGPGYDTVIAQTGTDVTPLKPVTYIDGCYGVDSATLAATDYPTSPVTELFGSLSASLEGLIPTVTFYNTQGLFEMTGTVVTAGASSLVHPLPANFETETGTVVFGIPFTATIIPSRPDAGSQIGTSQAAIKKVHKITVRLSKTMQLKVGSSTTNFESIIFRDGSTPMGQSADLFSGDKLLQLASDYDRDAYVYLINDSPLPCCIVGIIYEGDTYD